MFLSEQNKREILSKYENDTSDKVLSHLKRNYPSYDFDFDWMETPFKQVMINDKMYQLQSNKKYLVNKIFQQIEDKFLDTEKRVVRRTIKKYIDGIS